nr:unnamed protein product [Callosobruchus chinensis]
MAHVYANNEMVDMILVYGECVDPSNKERIMDQYLHKVWRNHAKKPIIKRQTLANEKEAIMKLRNSGREYHTLNKDRKVPTRQMRAPYGDSCKSNE